MKYIRGNTDRKYKVGLSMKILFFEWGSYIASDIVESFKDNGIDCKVYKYCLADKNHDEVFEKDFMKEIKSCSYSAVFSVNYFPVVAECCHRCNIKYVSWSYDNPLNVINIEETLGYGTNYVFLFDRLQAEQYISKGYSNVFHLPLAVNARRLKRVTLSDAEYREYSSEISFVGNLYSSMLGAYMNPMNEYQKGFIDGICNAQGHIYGYYMIDAMLTDDFMDSIQRQYKRVQPDTQFVLPKEALSYAMAAEVTRKERLAILGVLSNHYKVNLYSKEGIDGFAKINHKGVCDYFSEMPKVFKASKINLNITLKILQSGIPLRTLDIMGAGGFVLSNYQPELAENFVNDEEVVMYDSIEDAFDKASFYLTHDDIRKTIADRANKKVLEEYDYDIRLKYIFNIVFG